jgi:hypothetical protein
MAAGLDLPNRSAANRPGAMHKRLKDPVQRIQQPHDAAAKI